MPKQTMLSLFSGSGGFELAGSLCGFEPVASSEIEPYPIAVTKSRFPAMKHLSSVTDINGAEIEPVDIVTFGSPCQDLSVAGKRAGLKHEANGDDETTRSGLFMEAVRIIKEMREATDELYPRWAVWENVPGAFSSNNGEDFRVVLEELIKIAEPNAVMPPVPKGGWAYADSYCGDGWSLAYRVFDAQYWGVPQRRRRIHLVLDLAGQCAGEVLFERESLRGYFETSRTPWQGTAGDAENCAGAADREGAVGLSIVDCVGGHHEMAWVGDKAPCLKATHYKMPPVICAATPIHDQATRFSGKRGDKSDGKGNGLGVGEPGDPMNTLTSGDRHAVAYAQQTYQKVTGPLMANSHPGSYTGQDAFSDMLVAGPEMPIVFDKEVYNSGESGTGGHYIAEGGPSPTLRSTGHPPGVCVRYIVRRLTPTECARLQGFPDWWGEIDAKEDFTEEEYQFWLDVRNTHAAINGKAVKDYTKQQMLTWYNKLHTDSAEYKMWGNGIALPCALYVMQGIADASV